MNIIKNTIERYYKQLIHKGFFDIVFSTGFNKIVTLFTTIAITRILSKNEYGDLSYALNIVSIISIFSSAGLDFVLLQFASEQETGSSRNKIYKFCFTYGFLFNFLFCMITFLFALAGPLSIESGRKALISLSFLNCFQFLFKYITFFHRVELNNRQYGITTNLNSFSYLIFSTAGAYVFGINGVIEGRYIAFVLATMGSCFLFDFNYKQIFKSSFPTRQKRIEMIRYGGLITATNAISEVLLYIDIFVIGIVLGSTGSIAEYKVAMTLPFALNCIPNAIVTFIYPYFARKRNEISWIRRKYYKIVSMMIPINAIICIIGFSFASSIIHVIFGDGYESSVSCFRILMVSYFFSGTFRIISGNVIAMLRKIKINLVLDSLTSIVNIVLDYFLVKNYGSIGAAVASFIVVFLSSILSTFYLCHLFNKSR